MKINDNIKPYGLFSTIVVTVVGVGIFSYPREMTEAVGNDGWIVTLVAGFFSLLLLYLIYEIEKLNDFSSFTDIVVNNFGKLIGFFILISFSIYMTLNMSIQMRVFVEVIKMYLLEKTPTEFLIAVTILAGAYVVRFGTNNLVRFNELAFFIMFIPAIFMLLVVTKGADFTNVLPMFQNKPIDYFTAIYSSFISFSGFEIAYLILPLYKNKDKGKRPLLKAIIFITFFYIIITVFCIAVFSREQVKHIIWPTITMITSIDLPGAFVERWEGVVMTLWILFYFATLINFYYFTSDIVKDIFNFQDTRISLAIVMPFIYMIALYPRNITEIYNINTTVTRWFIMGNLIVLPIILLIISRVKYRNKKEHIRK